MIRTYSELIKIKTFSERFEYLRLNGNVCQHTFGDARFLNQDFYNSKEWAMARRDAIIRDHGCDLGVRGYDILIGKIIVHHMNPLTPYDIIHGTKFLLNLEYLITTSSHTHELISYGAVGETGNPFKERKPNDTCPWKQ